MNYSELTIYRHRLPHWRLEGNVYFVTWRLHPNQECFKPEERDIVKSSLEYFDGKRYRLFAFVVMDDHVHVLFIPLGDHRIQDLVHTWKSFTAHEAQRRFNRRGSVWQDEYFDRIVRDEAEFLEKGNYILQNPRKRWPDIEDYPWVGLGKDG
ncbi:MAG: transposase [Calditrichota bacterium]